MAYNKKQRKGGSGGRLGRSNMSHWDDSSVIKRSARKIRRLEEREVIEQSFEAETGDEETDLRKYPRKSEKKEEKKIYSFMSSDEVQEYIELLSGEKIRFYYFHDYYAFFLLKEFAGGGKPLREIKKSAFARLLKKPVIKNIIAGYGDDDILIPGIFYSEIPEETECYLITFSDWGRADEWFPIYLQTSRPGKNLVLQLNFSNKHNAEYERLLKPDGEHPFRDLNHPVAGETHYTLAWARIDIDKNLEYALIEEIQNDWLRLALWHKERIEKGHCETPEEEAERKRFEIYMNKALGPHLKLWDEAVLSAALWLLKEEMGIRRIFYHTYDTGNILKNIKGEKLPPKSIYTKLPEKFCFRETDEAPPFLEEKVSGIKKKQEIMPKFYLLDFDEI